jgi:diguanylate cyclase (GGDEF)-like protein
VTRGRRTQVCAAHADAGGVDRARVTTAGRRAVVPAGALDVPAAARSAFADLAARTGLGQWWLVRRRGDEQVVLADLAGAGARSATVPWRSGVPAAALERGAPPVAARVADVPAYAAACAASGLDAASLVVVPVRGAEGQAVGALCGASALPHPDLAAHLPGVRAAAALLGLLLEQALLLDDVVRRAEHAEAAAQTDPLTGLGNRRAWDAAISAEEDRAARHGTPTAVVVLDLDGLKQLNDTAGHDAGDEVLRQAGAALRAQVRGQDAVVRLGGDEFGLLLPDTERDVAVAVAARVRAALAEVGVGASCGVGTRTGQDGLLGAWRAADEAMYADKRARRGRSAAPLSSSGAWAPRSAPGPAPSAGRAPVLAAAERGVDALLEVARAQLGADVAFISVFEGGQRRFRNVVSQVPVPFSAGTSEPRDGTVCDLLARGELPGAIPDTSDSPVAGHRDVRALSVGAHAGVVLRRADGSTYGTLCAYSQRPDPHLRPRDADALAALGQAVMGLVEAEDAAEATARAVRARLEGLDALGGLRTRFRPVLSLADGARVGHDAETHFPRGTAPRGTWFSEARAVGASEPLETAALHDALEASRDLPPDDGWLLVGASAPTVSAPAFTRRMAAADPSRLVLQVLGDVEPAELRCLRAALAPLRREGLRLAVAAAGTARNGGEHMVALEPELVGVHRRVVAGVAGSRAQQALVNGLVGFASTLGAQLLARGPASAEDLDWLRSAGVPLAHGGPAAAPEPAPEHVSGP